MKCAHALLDSGWMFIRETTQVLQLNFDKKQTCKNVYINAQVQSKSTITQVLSFWLPNDVSESRGWGCCHYCYYQIG